MCKCNNVAISKSKVQYIRQWDTVMLIYNIFETTGLRFLERNENVKWGTMPPSWEVRVPAVLLMPPNLGFQITWECHLFKKVLQTTGQRGLQWFKNSAWMSFWVFVSAEPTAFVLCMIFRSEMIHKQSPLSCLERIEMVYSSLEVVNSEPVYFTCYGDDRGSQKLGFFVNSVFIQSNSSKPSHDMSSKSKTHLFFQTCFGACTPIILITYLSLLSTHF